MAATASRLPTCTRRCPAPRSGRTTAGRWRSCCSAWGPGPPLRTAPPGYVVDAATFAKHDNRARIRAALRRRAGRARDRRPQAGARQVPPHDAARRRALRPLCPWVNNAVGEENYRWFLLFLASHALLLAYGAACAALLLRDVVDAKQLMRATPTWATRFAATLGVAVRRLFHTAACCARCSWRARSSAPSSRASSVTTSGWSACRAATNSNYIAGVALQGGAALAANVYDLGAPQRARGPLPRDPRRAGCRCTGRRKGDCALCCACLRALLLRGNTGTYPPAPV